MSDAIAVLNAGSSSIKFSLFLLGPTELDLELRGQIEGLFTEPHFIAKDRSGAVLAEKSWGEGVKLGHAGALDHLVGYLRQRLGNDSLIGVGHRVVHGGIEYTKPVRVDAGVLKALEKFVPLAPLHQPHNLAPIRLLLERVPELPQIACFDTSFHRSNPEIAQMFALPAQLHAEGVRRYGFHGLSYEYIASVLPSIDPIAAAGRTVVLHLGNGASMSAFQAGRSMASTMGFTAVEGLPMGTRCGSVDPGVILYLMDQRGMDARAIEKLIYSQSGLLGVSGISSDMRTLLASEDPQAKLAVDLYLYRIRRELGSLAAALSGLDAVVFTAGIGENSAVIRERVCRDAAWLGLELDAPANSRGGPGISTTASKVSAWVIPTNEELMIARHTRALLASAGSGKPQAPAPVKDAPLNQYSATETLRDGRRIEIRALKPTDRDEIENTVSRMSDESLYRRFFSPRRRFSEQEAAYFLNVDFVNHVALVAILKEDGHRSIVGGARYVVTEPGTAEVAFAVDDPHQGQGIGLLLMKHLTEIARKAGINQLIADVLPNNAPMLKVFERSGLGMNTRRDRDVTHITLRLA
jgi:acetate kinase